MAKKAPATPTTVMAPILTFEAAPLCVEVALLEVPEEERVAGVVVALAAVDLLTLAVLETAGVEGAPGVVFPALIWAWTVALNWPDIPARVNLAENAWRGKVGLAGSLTLADWKRMKYWLLLGPIAGLTVNWIAAF